MFFDVNLFFLLRTVLLFIFVELFFCALDFFKFSQINEVEKQVIRNAYFITQIKIW